jgi:TM2 domain-containing membrane protein YozV/predicted RNA-binding Zn-ribbon protein involved in translation (DUF1610 family)
MNDELQVNPTNEPTKAADQKHCFSCGTLLHFSALQCPKCGAQQPTPQSLMPTVTQNQSPSIQAGPLHGHQAFCRGCGAVIHDTAVTCPKCGAPQRLASPTSNSGKERITAVVLAFFLGWIGGHKFYLGRVFQGILYLFFCWTFIPAFLAFIEGIIYLTMSDSDFSKKYS